MIGDREVKATPAGADEVYPLVVYGLLKGNVRKLKSNLTYIEHFRHHTRLESEEEYYYTTLSSAVEFIENLSTSTLTIKPKEFESLKEENTQKLRNIEVEKNPYIKSKSKALLTI